MLVQLGVQTIAHFKHVVLDEHAQHRLRRWLLADIDTPQQTRAHLELGDSKVLAQTSAARISSAIYSKALVRGYGSMHSHSRAVDEREEVTVALDLLRPFRDIRRALEPARWIEQLRVRAPDCLSLIQRGR